MCNPTNDGAGKAGAGILQRAAAHIERHGLEMSPEELLEEFARIVQCHRDFENYLRTSKKIYELNKMRRNQRLKEKRRLFVQWYFNEHQDQMSKSLQIDLSEMVFVTPRTIRGELVKETSV